MKCHCGVWELEDPNEVRTVVGSASERHAKDRCIAPSYTFCQMPRCKLSAAKNSPFCEVTHHNAEIPGTSLNPGPGRKDDAGKLPYDLLPWPAVAQVVAVLQFGARKYAPTTGSRLKTGDAGTSQPRADT